MVHRVQDLSLHSVGMFEWPARPGYVQDLTLGWIKFHIPCSSIQPKIKVYY